MSKSTVSGCLLAVSCLMLACGGDSSEASNAPGAASGPAAAAEASGAATAETPAPEAPSEGASTLPVPVPPASWRTTMGELSVDGTTVRDLSATCGMLAVMPVVQVIAAATQSCADRSGVVLAATFEGGRVTAVEATGAGAACVREAVVQATTNIACQFQLTF